MKAVVIHGFGGREVLKCTDFPMPEPGEGEVLVRARAAGVNPVDRKIRAGRLKDFLPVVEPDQIRSLVVDPGMLRSHR